MDKKKQSSIFGLEGEKLKMALDRKYTIPLLFEGNKSEKKELLEMLWELVAADSLIDPYEENLFFKIADLIKIPPNIMNKTIYVEAT